MNIVYYINTSTLKKDEFDKVVAEVLKRPEYKRLHGDYVNFIDRIRNIIMDWIKAWLERLFSMEDKLGAPAFGISNGIVIIGLILLVFLVIILFFSMKKIVGKNQKVRTIFGEEISATTTAEGLRNKASEYKSQGDYREAIRIGFISLLLKMNEKNLLYLDETKTNEEMTKILKNNDFKYIRLFQSITYLFNEAWFGHKSIQEDEFSLWEGKMDELWNGVLSIENKG